LDKNFYIKKIAAVSGISIKQVKGTVALLDEEATVPFIARYRKETTGSLDETEIINIRDRLKALVELDKRRDTILKSIEEQGKLTQELSKAIQDADSLSVLEDIYLPFKPKRKTRAIIAKEKGLEPLALIILKQEDIDVKKEAKKYVNTEKEVNTIEDALIGAQDIIAEIINEDPEIRNKMRKLFTENAYLSSKVIKDKEKTGVKYKDYFDWKEKIAQIPSHRLLAVLRGTAEGYLSHHILPEQEKAVPIIEIKYIKNNSESSAYVKNALNDCYKRLLSPSMENEIRTAVKNKADTDAIKVFAGNLKELLLSAPLGQKNVLAIDPGFRTGCKVVCLDSQGKLLFADTIYPLEPHNRLTDSEKKLKELWKIYKVEAVAVGNGTGGREAKKFCESIDVMKNPDIVMVNESGASVYSASKTARLEFPDYDVTVRGAVSIGRRLMDPLAELVKIDPKSIGVGQYQHDVDQKELKKSLNDVVVSCVNAVGCEVNTASTELLSFVSGLSLKTAGSIVKFRAENGAISSREELLKIPGMGAKTYEQCAGFLRIRNSPNPLDASGVHPESYHVVEIMAEDLGCNIIDLLKKEPLRKKIEIKKYVTGSIGLPTLKDILKELAKPGRDPRAKFESFSFSEGVNNLEDLESGARLPGIVTNVTAFGAFVDIGVHQDGLVHISQLSDSFVKNPLDVVKVHQRVTVTVLSVDIPRKRIALTMKEN
jgi:uncharacterized protein